MPAPDFNTLAEEAKCYLCLGISLAEAIEIALLNRIASGGSSGEGVPSGVILMWSGSIASIPAGWVLCNGANGTPDLRDRFVPGAGTTYAVGDTGGATTHTHTITDPGHDHPGSIVASPADLEFAGIAPDGSYGPHVTVASDTTGITINNGSSLPPYYALAYIMKT